LTIIYIFISAFDTATYGHYRSAKIAPTSYRLATYNTAGHSHVPLSKAQNCFRPVTMEKTSPSFRNFYLNAGHNALDTAIIAGLDIALCLNAD
jgi:hypothetical protein